MTIEAIGGWLKDADPGMNRSYRRLDDLDPSVMSPEHIAYFEDYRNRYFIWIADMSDIVKEYGQKYEDYLILERAPKL